MSKEESPVTGTISPADVAGLEGDIFAAYEHFTGRVTILGKDDKIEVTLADHDEYCLYVFVPYVDGFAPIGLLDKFISPAAITGEAGGDVTLYEGGRYGYVKNGEFVVEER